MKLQVCNFITYVDEVIIHSIHSYGMQLLQLCMQAVYMQACTVLFTSYFSLVVLLLLVHSYIYVCMQTEGVAYCHVDFYQQCIATNCSYILTTVTVYRIAGNFRREKFSEISEKTTISKNIFPNILWSYIQRLAMVLGFRKFISEVFVNVNFLKNLPSANFPLYGKTILNVVAKRSVMLCQWSIGVMLLQYSYSLRKFTVGCF